MKQLELPPPVGITSTRGMSQWLPASKYKPMRVGAYACRTVTVIDTFEHHRWWNGEKWSYPIEPDLNDEFAAPKAEHYPVLPDEVMPFVWRGFNEDQDPL